MITLPHIPSFVNKWILGPIWHLIWPRQCSMCGKVLTMDEDLFCSDCLTLLPRTEEATHRDNVLEQKFAGDDKFVRGAAYCFYPVGHRYRNAIHAFKYGNQPEIGELLAAKAAEEWQDTDFFDGIDYIIPIPLHKKRLKERGYNQAEWIAKGLQQQTGIPIDTTHLVRKVNNDRQSLKTLEERKELDDIFSVVRPEELRNKHVLLVDDVVTSGSTMQMAMKHLHAIRGCHYSVFSLAVAKNNHQ